MVDSDVAFQRCQITMFFQPRRCLLLFLGVSVANKMLRLAIRVIYGLIVYTPKCGSANGGGTDESRGNFAPPNTTGSHPPSEKR